MIDYQQRIQFLKALRQTIAEHEKQITQCLSDDFDKHPFESFLSEIYFVQAEISFALKNLKKWMKPKRVPTPITLQPSCSKIIYEAKGHCLIISPWNYPFQLAMTPLVAAIAAGNKCTVKPSEMTPMTAQITEKIIRTVFPKEIVAVVQGGVSETQELLRRNWDHIFFTGSTNVGKIIYQAAAKNLTTVTLELGGKSPTIVTETANLDVAAKRIVWGKFVNGGQTCIAPDYLLVQEKVKTEFVKKLIQQINELLQDKTFRIINAQNFSRLKNYLQNCKIEFGGNCDEKTLRIGPTIVSEITSDHALIKEEIFGPILLVQTYTDWENMISELNKKEKPLSAYLFSQDKIQIADFTNTVKAGGMTINDCLLHIGNPNLPFGGINQSGIGNYHGYHGFVTFSHAKAILHRSSFFAHSLWLPPYSEKKWKWVRRILRWVG